MAPAKKKQIDRFREAARALGTDEDEAAFKAKLAVIGKQKPTKRQTILASPKDKTK